MKAVYSFYSAPYGNDPAANPGNWSRPGVEFFFWAWSVLQTRKWASRVELVTDQFGARLFEELGIEFDSVRVALDDVERAGGKLWAIGKIKAYSLQDEPFVHLDGDAWFATPPGEEVFAPRVVCQSKEATGPESPYHRLLREILQATDDTEPYRLFHAIGARQPVAACLSVYATNDLELNARYCRQARAFYDAHVAHRPGTFTELHDWNLIVEQLMLGEVYFQTFDEEPTYLLPVEKLGEPANDYDFCHVWGAKRADAGRLKTVGRLRDEHPEVFGRIARKFDLEEQFSVPQA